MIGSNSIQFRYVRRRVVEVGGGITWVPEEQFRTKDVTSSLLGLIPLATAWSAWQRIDQEGFIYVDEAGNEVTP